VGSRAILLAASPFAPGIAGFDELSKASRVTGVGGAEVGFLGTEQREPVPLDRLPSHATRAVLAAEDRRFYDHSGVDPAAVFGALRDNVLRQESRGGSTITQQLAKLNYTGSQRTYLRKLKEVMYASKLEDRYSKDQLLERYMNQVYFGEGAYGSGWRHRRSSGCRRILARVEGVGRPDLARQHGRLSRRELLRRHPEERL